MNKNAIKKLADNPHYSMSEAELNKLTQILAEEAEEAKEEEKEYPVLKPEIQLNKNRVKKTFVKINKSKAIKETDNVDSE